MIRNLVIDNDAAAQMMQPNNDDYTKLILWLMQSGCLSFGRLLYKQYVSTMGASKSPRSILILIEILRRARRLNEISQQAIQEFRIPERIERKLKSNQGDREILKTVLLSCGRNLLSLDNALRADLEKYPGAQISTYSSPGQIL